MEKELEETKKELERVKGLLQLYAGCNVCVHHEAFNKCNEGGKCEGKKWQC